ncbi:hypothetical protein LEP1GSC188_3262 [Leptospira weilii serovar Topaz str. LT2116]|uniref:Uncharacterized protein n=1 Tax=Leptospira weilii serovar Topaz str. LT2116 TaxID=1088540 RepID=M3FN53_9LEPT|nr:hypothetical protein LEP1GSC188_3262 [Leptospira weilii serovar Topaz str. LT2116]
MSLDMNSLPNDVKELKKIIIFQNNKLIDQKQRRKSNIRKKSDSKS